MTDLIDSLKRLERAGSETSKTTEKLIAAAADVERKIVGAFGLRSTDPGISFSFKAPPRRDFPHLYSLNDECLQIRDPNGKFVSVSANRTAALMFSEDIAEGVLDTFVEGLDKINSRLPNGLEVLLKRQ